MEPRTIEFAALMHILRGPIPTVPGAHVGYEGKFSEPNDFNGNITWGAALDAAEFGKWDAPEIHNLTLPNLPIEQDQLEYVYDVTGNQLDVSAYLTGEPECFLVDRLVRRPGTGVLRFAVEIGGNSGVHANHMKNRGQAIIALVNSLELQGYSCEVSIVRSFIDAKTREEIKAIIPVKNAGFALDTKRLQFVIGHPGFYRRCLFAFGAYLMGHDASSRTTTYKPEGGAIHIPHTAGLCATLADSLKWATEFAKQIETIN